MLYLIMKGLDKICWQDKTYSFPKQSHFGLASQALVVSKFTIALFIVRIRFMVVHHISSHRHFTLTWLPISKFCNRLPTFSCVFCRQLFVDGDNDQSISRSVTYWFDFTKAKVVAHNDSVAFRHCVWMFTRASEMSVTTELISACFNECVCKS